MGALLDLMHSRHNRIELQGTSTANFILQLYDVLIVADKYQCIGSSLLRPWAASWVNVR